MTKTLEQKLDDVQRENTALRVALGKHTCPYGHRTAEGYCQLGYPGCACADDQTVFFSTYGNGMAVRREALLFRLREDADAVRAVEALLANDRDWHLVHDTTGFYLYMASGFDRDDGYVLTGGSPTFADVGREVLALDPLPTSGPVPPITTGARSLDDWHEDRGPALWWRFPVEEPPYVGSPLDDDWPGYHTHWTPLPVPPVAPNDSPSHPDDHD